MNQQKLFAWLKENPIIDKSKLCRAVGYDRSSLSHAMDGKRTLPEDIMIAMIKVLKKYGYR